MLISEKLTQLYIELPICIPSF